MNGIDSFLNSLSEGDRNAVLNLFNMATKLWNSLDDKRRDKNMVMIDSILFPDGRKSPELIEGVIRAFVNVPVLIKTELFKSKGVIKKTLRLTETGENVFLIIGYLLELYKDMRGDRQDDNFRYL